MCSFELALSSTYSLSSLFLTLSLPFLDPNMPYFCPIYSLLSFSLSLNLHISSLCSSELDSPSPYSLPSLFFSLSFSLFLDLNILHVFPHQSLELILSSRHEQPQPQVHIGEQRSECPTSL